MNRKIDTGMTIEKIDLNVQAKEERKKRIATYSVLAVLLAAVLAVAIHNMETRPDDGMGFWEFMAVGGALPGIGPYMGMTQPETPAVDRAGNPISIPESIETIVSIGPSVTEVLLELGLGHKIIATDTLSAEIEGVPGGLPLIDMFAVDAEALLMLQPDIVFATGMVMAGGNDPLAIMARAGTPVLYIPASDSIGRIIGDIVFIATVVDMWSEGMAIAREMLEIMDVISAISQDIGEQDRETLEFSGRRTVYFEIEAAPFMFSFGGGTFLNEMLTLIGAENILAGHEGWVSVADEQILAANPDVILTNVSWMDNPIGEIKSRPGWSGISAVANSRVFLIDADASSRPSHNIIRALVEMAEAVYPEYFLEHRGMWE